ncbi:hypothetical protein ACPCIU_15695 [Streptomyces seoulensis]|uniref:hypothetical protein n=1 Tax=Streptomyces seoulensis TaxID=73044 RepID=UPI003C2B8669
MGKPDTRRLDREIRTAERKLEAVRNRELWPLNSRESRAVLGAAVSGSYRVTRGRSTSRAEQRLDTAWQSAETRLMAEIAAMQLERAQIVRDAAKAKAAKKSTGWF